MSNDILNAASIAVAAHDAVKLGEVGVNYVKAVAPEIKSIFSKNGLSELENISGKAKTVTFNSMEFVGDLSETSYVKSIEKYTDDMRKCINYPSDEDIAYAWKKAQTEGIELTIDEIDLIKALRDHELLEKNHGG